MEAVSLGGGGGHQLTEQEMEVVTTVFRCAGLRGNI